MFLSDARRLGLYLVDHLRFQMLLKVPGMFPSLLSQVSISLYIQWGNSGWLLSGLGSDHYRIGHPGHSSYIQSGMYQWLVPGRCEMRPDQKLFRTLVGLHSGLGGSFLRWQTEAVHLFGPACHHTTLGYGHSYLRQSLLVLGVGR